MKFLKRPKQIKEWQIVFNFDYPTFYLYEHWAREISFGILKVNTDEEAYQSSFWLRNGFYINFIIHQPFRLPFTNLKVKCKK